MARLLKLSSLQTYKKSIFLMLLACLCFSAMTTLINLGCMRFPSMQIIFARGLVDCLIVIPILLKSKIKLIGNNPSRLFVRGTFGFLGASCIFWAVKVMPIANAVSLFRAMPLFMPFFAYFLLKEKIYLKNIFLALFGFSGALLILKPTSNYEDFIKGLIPLLGALFNCLAFVTVKHLSSRESPYSIMFYFFILSVVYPLLFLSHTFLMPQGVEILYLLLVGICGFIGQYFMTVSFKDAPAGVVAPWTYGEIVFSAILGIIFLHQTPDLLSLVGAIIIVFSAISIQPTQPTASSAKPGM